MAVKAKSEGTTTDLGNAQYSATDAEAAAFDLNPFLLHHRGLVSNGDFELATCWGNKCSRTWVRPQLIGLATCWGNQ